MSVYEKIFQYREVLGLFALVAPLLLVPAMGALTVVVYVLEVVAFAGIFQFFKQKGVDWSLIRFNVEQKQKEAFVQQQRNSQIQWVYNGLPPVLRDVTGRDFDTTQWQLIPNGIEFFIPRGTLTVDMFDSEKILGGLVQYSAQPIEKVLVGDVPHRPGVLSLKVMFIDPMKQ